ncbi:MAG: winged helix DNA-binding protein [Desulfurococcales archaeon]|nr:winged helix DNA-binding protein [Desulfurococcales archaeon]
MSKHVNSGEPQCEEALILEAIEAVAALLSVIRNEAVIRIYLFILESGEPVSVRKISRNTGLGHRHAIRRLRRLEEAGLVEKLYSASNMSLYVPTGTSKRLYALVKGKVRRSF